MNSFFKSDDLSNESNQLILVIDDKDAEFTPELVKSLTEDMIKVITKHIVTDRSNVKVSVTSDHTTKKIIFHIPVVNVPRGR
ncbi:cell division topological specificity factor MinE [Heliophilum fasciatum]|uniref:Septum formation topological specificity factor MinE n=1 Tax=Heliophilum fasciatum TaxID=35700 RepID=A0A4R2RHS7_9FIRM|nr:septum formation topological specificity factor MinE [Heliophilum fasciatum]TCP58735.1 septum formation topological specificity factor MinE [Heliophilum fasciatum]